MIYKTYNKTLNNLTEKVKKIFKYNIIGKIEFTNYTDDIKQAKIIYKYYIYKNKIFPYALEYKNLNH